MQVLDLADQTGHVIVESIQGDDQRYIVPCHTLSSAPMSEVVNVALTLDLSKVERTAK